ncbi:MAG: DUF2079 domain-containing protein [Planctomycetaceae bacterium]|nr:DUF2079 domain-containing protein [Planctomycetaceae bacterium]
MAGLSAMIHRILVTPELAAGVAPRDLLRSIVGLMGGTLDADSRSGLQIELPYLHVLLRIATGILILLLLSGFRLRRSGSVHRNREQPSDLVRRTGARASLSFAWLVLWYFVSPLPPESQVALFTTITAPLFAGVVCGLALNAALPTPPPIPEPDMRPHWRLRSPPIVLGLLTIGWTGVSFWLNERLYAGLWIPHGDSAMYEEHLWNVWHGKGFRSYLDQGLFLGEHIQVIHLLLLPLHMLWPSHLLLELAESIALGICVVPVYRLARRSSRSPTAAAWLAASWLFFYPMHFLDIAVDLKTLRPICFGMPFLLFAIERADRGAVRMATLCIVLALAAKEDFALTTAMVGGVMAVSAFPMRRLAVEKRRQFVWGTSVFVGSLLYLLLSVLVIIPWFRHGAPVHYARYFGDLGGTPAELIRTTLQNPWKVLSHFIQFRTLYYLCILLLPAAALALRSPLRLAAGAVSFVMLSLIQLSSVPDAVGFVPGELPPVPFHHFHAPLLVIIYWAAAAGLPELRGAGDNRAGVRGNPIVLARGAFLCAILTGICSSLTPYGLTFWSEESRFGFTQLYVPGDRARMAERVVRLIPQQARVASTDYIHTRLTHCERSYDYSDYLRAVNNYRPGVPPDTDYIVIDTTHPYSTIHKPEEVPELRHHPEEWELLKDETNGMFIVLRRRAAVNNQ